MKARKRAQLQRPTGRNPLDDPATLERIDKLMGALSCDPGRLWHFELHATETERDLVCLYAARERPADSRGGFRHFTACSLSLSWQSPEHYGPTAPPDVRRQKLIGLLMADALPAE